MSLFSLLPEGIEEYIWIIISTAMTHSKKIWILRFACLWGCNQSRCSDKQRNTPNKLVSLELNELLWVRSPGWLKFHWAVMHISKKKTTKGRRTAHLGSQKSCQVDLWDHLAAAVALLLIPVFVVLHQMPNLDAALQVRSDHGGPRAQAVWASRILDHVLCEQTTRVS